jgi:hypothetical protein
MARPPFRRSRPFAGPRLATRGSIRAAAVLALVVGCLTDAAARPPAGAPEEFVIIVNRENPATYETRGFVAKAFLKKASRWDGGAAIQPADQGAESEVRRMFSERVLERPVSAVRAYWQQRIFSGRDLPPVELDSDEAVVHYVSRYRGAIGYVSGSAKLGEAKVIEVR